MKFKKITVDEVLKLQDGTELYFEFTNSNKKILGNKNKCRIIFALEQIDNNEFNKNSKYGAVQLDYNTKINIYVKDKESYTFNSILEEALNSSILPEVEKYGKELTSAKIYEYNGEKYILIKKGNEIIKFDKYED